MKIKKIKIILLFIFFNQFFYLNLQSKLINKKRIFYSSALLIGASVFILNDYYVDLKNFFKPSNFFNKHNEITDLRELITSFNENKNKEFFTNLIYLFFYKYPQNENNPVSFNNDKDLNEKNLRTVLNFFEKEDQQKQEKQNDKILTKENIENIINNAKLYNILYKTNFQKLIKFFKELLKNQDPKNQDAKVELKKINIEFLTDHHKNNNQNKIQKDQNEQNIYIKQASDPEIDKLDERLRSNNDDLSKQLQEYQQQIDLQKQQQQQQFKNQDNDFQMQEQFQNKDDHQNKKQKNCILNIVNELENEKQKIINGHNNLLNKKLQNINIEETKNKLYNFYFLKMEDKNKIIKKYNDKLFIVFKQFDKNLSEEKFNQKINSFIENVNNKIKEKGMVGFYGIKPNFFSCFEGMIKDEGFISNLFTDFYLEIFNKKITEDAYYMRKNFCHIIRDNFKEIELNNVDDQHYLLFETINSSLVYELEKIAQLSDLDIVNLQLTDQFDVSFIKNQFKIDSFLENRDISVFLKLEQGEKPLDIKIKEIEEYTLKVLNEYSGLLKSYFFDENNNQELINNNEDLINKIRQVCYYFNEVNTGLKSINQPCILPPLMILICLKNNNFSKQFIEDQFNKGFFKRFHGHQGQINYQELEMAIKNSFGNEINVFFDKNFVKGKNEKYKEEFGPVLEWDDEKENNLKKLEKEIKDEYKNKNCLLLLQPGKIVFKESEKDGIKIIFEEFQEDGNGHYILFLDNKFINPYTEYFEISDSLKEIRGKCDLKIKALRIISFPINNNVLKVILNYSKKK